MNGLLKICAAETATLDWSLIWSTVLVGLVVVFAILGILIGIFYLMGAVFTSIDKAKKKKAVSEAIADAPIVVAIEPADEAETYDEEDNDEIIAVISAAIAAYGEAEGKQYRIANITKRDNKQRSSWSAAGIADNTRGF